MWEVEPTLYWRVKIGNKWTYVRAKNAVWTEDGYVVKPIRVFDVEGE